MLIEECAVQIPVAVLLAGGGRRTRAVPAVERQRQILVDEAHQSCVDVLPFQRGKHLFMEQATVRAFKVAELHDGRAALLGPGLVSLKSTRWSELLPEEAAVQHALRAWSWTSIAATQSCRQSRSPGPQPANPQRSEPGCISGSSLRLELPHALHDSGFDGRFWIKWGHRCSPL